MTDGPDLRVVGGNEAWKSRDEWLDAGRRLGERIERDRWALGDWACHGERAYGDLAEAAAIIDIGYGYLRNLATVARKIELSRRRDDLSWDYHAAVAALPAKVGDELLDRAEAEGWSRAVIREEAQAASREAQLEVRIAALEAENDNLRGAQGRAALARRAMDRRKERVRGLMREIALLYGQVAEILEDPAAHADARQIHGNTNLRDAIEKIIIAGMGRCDAITRERIDAALAGLQGAAQITENAE